MGVGVVRLLGPVQFIDADGADVPLRSASMRRLLAVLAVSRSGPLRSEHLVDLLGISPSALRTSVSRLRSRIGDATILSDPTGYQLDCRVDAQTFIDLLERSETDLSLARIEDALGWWRGSAIEEFRHEPWAEAEAAKLDEMRLIAVERRIELLTSHARCGEAVAAAEALVAAHPYRDRARGLLMEALAGDGRQAESLRAFQDYRSFLSEESGTEPSAHVRSIERRVAAGWHELGRSSSGTARRAVEVTPSRVEIPLPGALDLRTTIVGRAAQLALLEADFAAARRGSIRVARISGDAGIGKTTLLAAFAHACRDTSASVLYGRCDETSVPLQPFRSLVRTLVEHVPLKMLAEHVEVHGGELARLAPHLRARTWTPDPVDRDGEIEQFHLFEAISDLIRRAASANPVVLVLDDLHWAERTALMLLHHLVRALIDAPVLVVISTRGAGDRLPDELRGTLADIDGVPTRRIKLGALEDAELAELSASLLGVDLSGDPESIEALKDQTAGNPLYASQLLMHLHERGETVVAPMRSFPWEASDGVVPPGLVDLLWRRVHELGPAAARVLQACSVLAPVIRPGVLESLFDADTDVASSVDVAIASGLLYETGAIDWSLRFTHSLVAQALYDEIPRADRRALHRRVLEALTSVTERAGHASPIELTVHAAAADDHTAATRWGVQAGESALENLAPTEASRWFRTALDHAVASGVSDAEQAALEVRLGAAQLRAGDPDARATLLTAADRARRSGADRTLVEAVLAHDRGLMRIGSIDEQLLDMIGAALEVADQSDGSTYGRLLALHALHLVHTARIDERLDSAHRSIDLIERSEDALLLPQMISSLLFALSGPGTLDLRRDLALRAALAADRSADPHLRFWTARAAHFIAIESADPAMASIQLRRMEEIATATPETRLRWVSTTALAFTAIMEARLADADELIERALGLGLQVGDPDAMSVYAGQLFACRSFAGRYDEMLPLLDAANRATPGVRPFELAHAITLAATGDVDQPRKLLRAAAASDFADVPLDYLWMTAIIGYAVLAIELEDTAAAAPLFGLLEPFGHQVAFTGATSQGFIGAYLGKLASLLGRHDQADAYLARSLDVARSFGWRYHEATTLVALARARSSRMGSVDHDSHSWLTRASQIANDCDLPIVARQVRSVHVPE